MVFSLQNLKSEKSLNIKRVEKSFGKEKEKKIDSIRALEPYFIYFISCLEIIYSTGGYYNEGKYKCSLSMRINFSRQYFVEKCVS